jgi:FkbM family methyltransferase
VRLNLYRHKGYWYHRRNRERDLMVSLQRLVRPGMRAVEIGGHIGWITIHLAELVGGSGTVEVFEPSPANLPYLRANTAPITNVRVVEAAASDHDGNAAFFLEELTGQNDTLIADYEVFDQNRALARASSNYVEVTVRTVRLDTELDRSARRTDFIKIDVEGAEDRVLRGAAGIIGRDRPVLAVEITRERRVVLEELARAGYHCFTTALRPVDPVNAADRNFIFVHPDRPDAQSSPPAG